MNGVHLRCVRCWALVSPSEASCAGCGASFSQEEIARAWTDRYPKETEPVQEPK